MSDGRDVVIVRFARPQDALTVHRFIRELAAFEREPDAVEATPESLAEQLASPRPPFECLIAEAEASGEALGFALFFANFSTWRGRPGLYVEDLYVTPAARGRGVGRALLRRIARLAAERGAARMEWAVLTWNQGAIDFYERLGAERLEQWRTFRLSHEALAALAREDA